MSQHLTFAVSRGQTSSCRLMGPDYPFNLHDLVHCGELFQLASMGSDMRRWTPIQPNLQTR
eukprot:5486105-Amphidinium_carterae.1